MSDITSLLGDDANRELLSAELSIDIVIDNNDNAANTITSYTLVRSKLFIL